MHAREFCLRLLVTVSLAWVAGCATKQPRLLEVKTILADRPA